MHRRRDYHFDLPPGQIAQHPADRRDASRLLVVRDPLEDRRFTELPGLLPDGAVVVVNDTRVIPARVRTRKPSGGAVELLFVEPAGQPGAWRCLARGTVRAGMVLTVEGDPSATLTVLADRPAGTGDGAVLVGVPDDVFGFLDRHGQLPLPPYIERAGGLAAEDAERYQTVYARTPGAIAAPTAGLHVTPAILEALAARGIDVAPVTLHVGLGTFTPVRADQLDEHAMHTERFVVPEATAALIGSGRPVVAIGTTVVRCLEAAATGPRQVAVGPGATALFIRPGIGFRWQIVDHLVTNFHLPESTLLMLVSAFAGYDRIRAAYQHAVTAGYRFFSYGDAMLLTRDPS